jgi:ATP-dependent RNA helicase DeaD
MSTFEELELAPELVEALAAEGLESPTALQADLIPVIRRGNNVVAGAGPGSGVLAAYAAPLLDRIPPEGDRPRVLILTPTVERAGGLADSVGRMALATGHRVAALGGLWVLPERAHVLVGTPEGVQERLSGGHLSLEAVEAVVVDGAASMAVSGSLKTAGSILEGVSPEAQRVVVALPGSPEVERFAEVHARKSVHVPSRTRGTEQSPHRGDLTIMETDVARDEAALRAVAHLLLEARHVVAFVRGEDAAADLGDFLALRGYAAGRPGDPDVPVWLAVEGLEARQAMDQGGADDVAVLSVDVPADADTLDRRHGGGRGGAVLVLPRELPHMKAVAQEAGYQLGTAPLPEGRRSGGSLAALLAAVEGALETEDTEAYQALMEPLFEKHGAGAVAAGALALLRKKAPAVSVEEEGPKGIQGFVRLFISVGKRDNVRPGDLVGAITGEAGVDAAQVGRIDLKDSFSLVEVERRIAEKVIEALNGTSIRGRAARVDFHREDRGGSARGDRGRGDGGRGERGRGDGGRGERRHRGEPGRKPRGGGARGG